MTVHEATASTAGFTIPSFAFLRSPTRTQDEEDAAGQEHYGNNCCEIYDEPVCQSTSCMFFIVLTRDYRLRSAVCPLRIAMRDGSCRSAVQLAALLDMT
jgi:hypothetical protein